MLRVHWWLPSLASLFVAAQVAPVAQAQTIESSPSRLKAVSTAAAKARVAPVDAEPPHFAQRPAPSPLAQVSTVEAIEITLEGNRLLIRSDNPLDQVSYWDRRTLAYQIELRNARLAPNVSLPDTRDSEAISWVQVEQGGPETVIVRVMPAPQVSVEGVNQPSDRLLSLELRPYSVEVAPPPIATQPRSQWDDLPVIPEGQVAIVLDPGHGGRDPGAVGIGGLSETDIVNPMSHRIKEILEQQGVRVILTREDNRTVDLEPRVQLANRLDANLFVSIHANAISMSRPDVNGVETYYYQTGGQLAQVLHRHLLSASGGPDRGVRTARFYVLRNTRMPAVLLELGFVTGARDAPRLADPAYQERLSQAIARGILEYVRQYCPGSLC